MTAEPVLLLEEMHDVRAAQEIGGGHARDAGADHRNRLHVDPT
jgi:hypothetical protein